MELLACLNEITCNIVKNSLRPPSLLYINNPHIHTLCFSFGYKSYCPNFNQQLFGFTHHTSDESTSMI